MLKYIFIILIVKSLLFAQTIFTFQSEGMNISLEKLGSNLNVPWGMTFISNSKLLITQKSGEIVS